MRGDQDRRPGPRGRLEGRDDPGRRHVVLLRRRLVEHEDRCSGDQDPGERGPLALAAGELRRPGSPAGPSARAGRRAPRPRPDRRSAPGTRRPARRSPRRSSSRPGWRAAARTRASGVGAPHGPTGRAPPRPSRPPRPGPQRGSVSPATRVSSVDLPLPDGPRRAVQVPGRSARSRSLNRVRPPQPAATPASVATASSPLDGRSARVTAGAGRPGCEGWRERVEAAGRRRPGTRSSSPVVPTLGPAARPAPGPSRGCRRPARRGCGPALDSSASRPSRSRTARSTKASERASWLTRMTPVPSAATASTARTPGGPPPRRARPSARRRARAPARGRRRHTARPAAPRRRRAGGRRRWRGRPCRAVRGSARPVAGPAPGMGAGEAELERDVVAHVELGQQVAPGVLVDEPQGASPPPSSRGLVHRVHGGPADLHAAGEHRLVAGHDPQEGRLPRAVRPGHQEALAGGQGQVRPAQRHHRLGRRRGRRRRRP